MIQDGKLRIVTGAYFAEFRVMKYFHWISCNKFYSITLPGTKYLVSLTTVYFLSQNNNMASESY
jgi:hypothetical protein